jgi:hypothetical protein
MTTTFSSQPTATPPSWSAVIETALGATFRPGHSTEPIPTPVTGTTLVFFRDRHPFEADADFAVTRYTYWVSIHDSARNADCQLATAQRVFEAAKARGWPAMLSYGAQGNLALYP